MNSDKLPPELVGDCRDVEQKMESESDLKPDDPLEKRAIIFTSGEGGQVGQDNKDIRAATLNTSTTRTLREVKKVSGVNVVDRDDL